MPMHHLNTFDGKMVEQVIHALEELPEVHRHKTIAINTFPSTGIAEGERFLAWDGFRKKHQPELVIYENMYEGHVRAVSEMVHRYQQRDPHPALIVYGSAVASNSYGIPFYTFQGWEQNMSYEKDMLRKGFFPYHTIPREKSYLCFNRMSRTHRIALLAHLHSKDLVRRGHYSFFPGMYGKSLSRCCYDLVNHMNNDQYRFVYRNLMDILPSLPLKLNTDTQNDNANKHRIEDGQYYTTSYFSLVTETFFFLMDSVDYDEVEVFFSEKIFKPIAAGHPFIMLNRPGALQQLRRLGYKTFDGIFDETYDTIEDDMERLNAIIHEIERLSSWTHEEWMQHHEEIVRRTTYNFQVLYNKTRFAS